ncbi:hypothetical protein BY458DRAFT_584119 [Sporodiniella umbellata]|nr:hypothetical protein BY458DRAFT_584119 [Sporodiniella umbellata]
MFHSSPIDLPTHSKTLQYAYSKTSYLTTLKQSLEIILSNQDSKQIFYFLLLNLSYMFVQLAYGVWTNSLGLISDAIHMFFDCLALGVGLFASVMSRWPSNSEYSYGLGRLIVIGEIRYNRIETLAAYFNGVFLIMISVSIIIEAIQRLVTPPEMNTHRLLIVSFLGLVVNLVGIFAFNHGHAHGGHHHGHDHGHDHGHSANMQGKPFFFTRRKAIRFVTSISLGVFLHIMADTLGSVGVIVSTLLIDWFGWTGFDPIASLFIASLIIASVLPLIRQSAAVLMLELDDATVAAVEGTVEEIKGIEGVYGVSQSRFWPYEAESVIGSLHVQVKDDIDTQAMQQTIVQLLQHRIHGLKEVCVQIEPQSAKKKNRTVPEKGFFHSPLIHSPIHQAHVNYRSNTSTPVPSTPPLTDIPHPGIAPIISGLQKQTKKE